MARIRQLVAGQCISKSDEIRIMINKDIMDVITSLLSVESFGLTMKSMQADEGKNNTWAPIKDLQLL